MPLRQLYPNLNAESAASNIARVDIIAVHGLNPRSKNDRDHAWDTWRTPSGPQGRLWLRDDLPQHVPETRIFLYEYNSTAVYGKDRDTFVGKANELLEAIRIERDDTESRPILLLGHSMGGLLIKQALINAHNNPKYTPIKDATTGLAFFATPHNGGDWKFVSLGGVVAKIATAVGFQKGDDVLETLKSGSIFSDIIQEHWRHQLLKYHIISFWGARDKIVPAESARFGMPGDRENVVKLNADHSGVCKFGSSLEDQDNFKLVRGNIRDLYKNALKTYHPSVDSSSFVPSYPLPSTAYVQNIEMGNHATRTDIRTEMQLLRNDVLSVMTGGRRALLASDHAVALRLSDADKADLARQVCEALVMHPSALRQSCDLILPRPGRSSRSEPSKNRQTLFDFSCWCRKRRIRRDGRYARYFGIRYEDNADHEPPCPFAASASRSWGVTVSVTLLPLISKTVAFTFGATCQGGGFSIVPHLTVYATVQRISSPMFRAFDQILMNSSDWEFNYFWDKKKENVKLLLQVLNDMVASGTGLLSDKDESGNTLLHETVQLVLLFKTSYKETPELQQLIRLAERAGVDQAARANRLNVAKPQLPGLELLRGYYTAQELILHTAIKDESGLYWDLVTADYFGRFGLEETRPTISLWLGLSLGMTLQNIAQFYKRYPHLLDAYDPIEAAIIGRSIDHLRVALDAPNCDIAQHRSAKFVGLSIVDMAVGWPEGLKLLVQSDFDVEEASAFAVDQDDLDSLLILATSTRWNPSKIRVLHNTINASNNVQQFLVDSIWDKRNQLYRLCLEHLTPEERFNIGVSDLRPLDGVARIAYKKLLDRDIVVPGSLEPGEMPLCCEIFCCIFDVSDDRALRFLRKLYSTGFRETQPVGSRWQSQVNYAATFFLSYAMKYIISSRPACLKLILWLLESGKSPTRRPGAQWPSIVFDLAMMFDNRLDQESWDLFSRLLGFFDLEECDSCNCLCSQQGCLPSRMFLLCKPRDFFYEGVHRLHKGSPRIEHRKYRDSNLLSWCRLASLSKSQTAMYLEDAVRVEVFDRLGMVHTCCKDPEVWDWMSNSESESSSPSQASEDERHEVQDDDAELSDQLDLIMIAFRQFAKRHVGTHAGLLSSWWSVLSEILPSIHRMEWCRRLQYRYHYSYKSFKEILTDIRDHRAEQERELLSKQGYWDLDFLEVIQLHFKDYLTTQDDSFISRHLNYRVPERDVRCRNTGCRCWDPNGRCECVIERKSNLRRMRNGFMCKCWDHNGGLGSWDFEKYGTRWLLDADGYWTD